MKKTFFKGVKHGIPIALGYVSVSFAFGIQAVGIGLSPLMAVLISMTNVTSAGQLAGINLMALGAPLTEMALTQLTINLRYALMSLSLSQRLDKTMSTLHRLCFAFCNTDEIFAVASSQPEKVGKWYLYGLMLTPYLGWALGTLMGAVAGTLLPVFFRTALGIAIYGMFLAIIIPPSRKQKSVCAVVLMSAVMSIALKYLPGLRAIPSGYAIILCAVVASCVGAWLFPIKEEAQ